MKIILLILMIFSDGDAGTMALQFSSYDDCSLGMAAMEAKILQNNTAQELKVVSHAMACVETRKSPQGAGT